MVRGLVRFKTAFAEHHEAFVLIGGTTCHLAMVQVGSSFRATHDFDIVLCLEHMDPDFVRSLWRFINAGGYAAREKRDGGHHVYRFHHPTDDSFPSLASGFDNGSNAVTLPSACAGPPVPPLLRRGLIFQTGGLLVSPFSFWDA